MPRNSSRRSPIVLAATASLAVVVLLPVLRFRGSPAVPAAESALRPAAKAPKPKPDQYDFAAIEKRFQKDIQPLLKKYCFRCHNADKAESGIRVDRFDGKLADRSLKLWQAVGKKVAGGTMPPEDEPQPTAAQRRMLAEFIRTSLNAARSRVTAKDGSVRRLTVAQYRNTLRDLLGIEDDFTEVLPPDAVSKDGFVNNGRSMLLSPLLLEAYFNIAEKALDRCIVDENEKPVIQTFRMDLGKGVNPNPLKERLILGALSHLLNNADFRVTELQPKKPFAYRPFKMRTKYRFIEGYRGNATVRGWREFDSIYHAVFACVRGTPGYPKGRPYEPIPGGLLLRPAIPSPEIFKVSSTYGPMANFKISLRELPDTGRFRVRVKAAKYDDALLLGNGAPIARDTTSITVDLSKSSTTDVNIPRAGIYQVDVYAKAGGKRNMLSLTLGKRHFSGQVKRPKAGMAFMHVRLPAGHLKLTADGGKLQRIVFTRLNENSKAAKKFRVFEKRAPRIGVHVGFRRDCGSTFGNVGEPQTVSSTDLKEYVFEGAIGNYPSPDVEKDNVNYLAGVREIAVRSEYTDGRDMPRLLIRSIEFEGPFYESWPPATHRRIFVPSKQKPNSPAYAREIIRKFAARAYRRPITAAEEASLFKVWKESFAANGDFRRSIKDALLVVLTSPQFLFLIENSATPEAEKLGPYELASKLSYFLWNTAPDERLLKLAAANRLHASLDAEVDRMIRDPRFRQFTREFTSQWLQLDKFDVVETDRKRYPTLTRDAKAELRKQPVRCFEHLIRRNLPVRNLIRSDVILANEVVAAYYGLADRTESGFDFVPVRHGKTQLGGVLSQAAILAGLSDGRESNPVKRGAWMARKIIAEPPDDPPPKVPALPKENANKLTLRQRLEQHRNQKGCVKCHSGVDPWGLPLEQFDAGGLLKSDPKVDASATLPDGTKVADFNGLRSYLANDRIDRVAFSVLKHLTTYAIGRRMTFNEIEFLKQKAVRLRPDGYRMQQMIRFVVNSPMFLEK